MGLRTDFVTRAQELIKAISPYFADCTTVEDYKAAVADYNWDNHTHIHVENGLTRVVLICSDYVIKISYGQNRVTFGDNVTEEAFYEFAEKEGYSYLFARPYTFTYNHVEYMIMRRIHGIDTAEYEIDYYLSSSEADWIEEHLYDIHSANFGFDEYDNPVIIDYACIRYANFPSSEG